MRGVGEKNDLVAKEPERLKRMTAEPQGMYRAVRDETPTWPASEWPRYQAERIQWPQPPVRYHRFVTVWFPVNRSVTTVC